MREERSAGGVVWYGDKVLILRNFRNEYIFPKGHIEKGETVEQAALREVAEEAGLQAQIQATLPDTAYKYRLPDGSWQRKRVSWFVMRVDSDRPLVDGDEIKWGAFMVPLEVERLLTHALDRRLLRQACAAKDGE